VSSESASWRALSAADCSSYFLRDHLPGNCTKTWRNLGIGKGSEKCKESQRKCSQTVCIWKKIVIFSYGTENIAVKQIVVNICLCMYKIPLQTINKNSVLLQKMVMWLPQFGPRVQVYDEYFIDIEFGRIHNNW